MENNINIAEQVISGLGIYPQKIVKDGVTTERTQWQDGWNAAYIEISYRFQFLQDWHSALSTEEKAALTFFEPSLFIHLTKKDDGCYDVLLAFNMNDVFYWGCADSEDVTLKELVSLHQIDKSGLSDNALQDISIAFACLKRNQTVQDAIKGEWRACIEEATEWLRTRL